MSTCHPQANRFKAFLQSPFITVKLNRSVLFPKRGMLYVLNLWIRRQTLRKELAARPDYLLEDIGLSRKQVDEEAQLPFWSPGLF